MLVIHFLLVTAVAVKFLTIAIGLMIVTVIEAGVKMNLILIVMFDNVQQDVGSIISAWMALSDVKKNIINFWQSIWAATLYSSLPTPPLCD